MTKELQVAHCPNCGNVFQKNLRNLCMNCLAEEDSDIRTIESQLKRNRQLNNEEVAEMTSIPIQRLRTLIRKGKIKLFDYPNLTDACDLCSASIRQGKLCVDCYMRIQGEIKQEIDRASQTKDRTFWTKE